MNCDQAFDHLTDPSATDDADLQRHLEVCPRCCAMQQTLSPALDWMASAAGDDAQRFLAGEGFRRTPFLTEESVAIATAAARQLPRHCFGSDVRTAMGIALVALFGMAFGVYGIGQPPRATGETVPQGLSAPVTACLWPNRDGERLDRARNAQAVVDSCIACHVPAMLRN